MNVSRLHVATFMTSLLLVVNGSAAQQTGPYVSVLGGVNVLQKSDVEIRPLDPSQAGFDFIPATIFFDPGGVAGGAIGYEWNNYAAELELAFHRGMLDRETLPFSPDPIPLTGHHDATSLMANVYYRFDTESKFRPYVGAGAGAAFLSLDGGAEGGPPVSVSDTRAAFQAIAGVSYEMNSKISVGLEYRYFVTDRPNYQIDIGNTRATINPKYRANDVVLRLTLKLN